MESHSMVDTFDWGDLKNEEVSPRLKAAKARYDSVLDIIKAHESEAAALRGEIIALTRLERDITSTSMSYAFSPASTTVHPGWNVAKEF
jgi:hypothetical protein